MKSIKKSFIMHNALNKTSLLCEIDIMRQLDHPNVIRLEEVYEDKRYIHLLLPLLSGNELYMRMKKKGRFSEEDAIPVIKKLLSALVYLQ